MEDKKAFSPVDVAIRIVKIRKVFIDCHFDIRTWVEPSFVTGVGVT